MYDNKRMNIINLIVLIVLVCNVKCDFVSGNHREEVRCVEKDREALLRFKKDLIDDYGILTSWGNETRKKECCKWRGVHCSNTTGHVIALQLINDVYSLGGQISSALLELHHLKDLDLSDNDFGGNIFPEFICSMTQLQHLDLGTSNFSGIVPPQLGNLTNLETLFLTDNDFTGVIPPQLGNLTNLQILALADNNMWSDNLSWLNSDLSFLYGLSFSGSKITDVEWAQHILKLPSLQELFLRTCGLIDVKPFSVGLSINSSSSTPSLSILDLSENNLISFTIDWLFNITSGTSPVATNLRTLYLWGNKLETLPASIWQLSKLKDLDVSSNSLEGTITEANLTKFHNLKNLALSFNSLTLDIKPGWVPPFQLDLISLAGCNMGPHFPLWLRTQSNFWWLDLFSNGISGEVPKWFWSLSPEINYLNISGNEFSGTLPDYSPTIRVIDVSFNKFSGHVPLPHLNTYIFQLSQNMFSGSISYLCTMPYTNHLWLLDLSSNLLEGKLPNCWQNMTQLNVLNLSNNSFSGEIPHGLGSLSDLYALQLGNNNLTGELPSTLKNCKRLQLFDVQDNMLTGNIPTWIGTSHESMANLIFRYNRFEGSIPPQICSLTQIQVLDLSRNHLSGNIPPCFNNFTYLVQKYNGWPMAFSFFSPDSMHSQHYIYYATISWKHQESEYKRNLRLLKLIDLSSNTLVGDIPRSFSSLKGLISLNLSRNGLIGTINPDIGQMEMLDSLDLSSNQLSGAIPVSMSQLSFLGVLDLSNNNLSGRIPPSAKLQSFGASFYAGNDGLCGIPLPLCPGDGPHPSTNNNFREIVDDEGILSFPFLQGLVISIILGFIFGFWGVVGSLIVKKSWRRAYFNFWDAVGNWFYVTTTIFWAKFRKIKQNRRYRIVFTEPARSCDELVLS